jgi:hypothetical protein
VEVHASEAKSGRNERSCLLPVGAKGFAILVQLGLEAAGAPACENLFHRFNVNAKEVGKRLEIWR